MTDRVWFVIVFIMATLSLIVQSVSPMFFINRTLSMPPGIYVKITSKYCEIGDIIVFNISFAKSSLIKYVVASNGSEYCFDESGSLLIDGFAIAQKNIEKYPQTLIAQSTCHQLSPDELLVIGDHENSYDSRYFGPIKKQDVIATVKLLWHIK